jgi:hypothetical protein
VLCVIERESGRCDNENGPEGESGPPMEAIAPIFNAARSARRNRKRRIASNALQVVLSNPTIVPRYARPA